MVSMVSVLLNGHQLSESCQNPEKENALFIEEEMDIQRLTKDV